MASTRDYDSWNRSRVELRADGWLDRGVDLRLCFKQLREMRRGEIWSIEKFVEEGGEKKGGVFKLVYNFLGEDLSFFLNREFNLKN